MIYYLIVLGVFLLIFIVYGISALVLVPGLKEERLGELEELPAGATEWRADPDADASIDAMDEGLVRETRLWIDPQGDWLGRERILRQTRYRDATTGEIVRTDPERRVRRKRVRRI